MTELGELEKQQDAFARRHVRVIAIANDDQETTQATQADFPHLVIVSDPAQNLAKAVEVIHRGVAPGGGDTNAPTTMLLDGAGTVRWLYRPARYVVRLTPSEVLAALDDARL